MSNANDRMSVIEQNYKSALENEPHDLAQATTAAQVTTIQANVAAARQVYFTAEATQLTQSGNAVEAAYTAAKAANDAVAKARTDAADIATLMSTLTSATTAANNLLTAAKSA